ncbi:MAG: hypothetical protein GOP50_09365 [Candidatus Heimdallarchaeota archaeon]|nr:hypothetical protein [Candidatus Heimdallarchaeota archaeon]
MSLKTKILLGVISLLVLTGIGLGVYFGAFYAPNGEPDPDPDPDPVVLTIYGDNSEANFTLTELKSLANVTGYAGYRKSTGTIVGPNLFKGVLLTNLIAEVGGLSAGEELEVISGDQYKVTFTNAMINGQFPAYDNITGDYLGIKDFRVIVAYEMDGQKLSTSDGVLRIACLAEEGEGYLSDGSPWVKDVQTIKVISSASWNVFLYGAINDSIDKATFEAFMYMNDEANLLVYQLLEDGRTNTYEGLALWRILALFDDDDPYTFNETLASNGYSIILKNALNESIILDSTAVSLNESFILAAKKNAIFLSDDLAPLILVGPGISEMQMINGIDRIDLEF